ncbi:hypothetical protein [Thermoanaerobacter ethanolicus]|uniref:hypothetical protein n=1 Tax=Thermoanaerobacter ethanolicus TaxID=1757 RepID=UPI001013C859
MKAFEFCTSLISERIGGEKMTYVKPTIQTLGSKNISLNGIIQPIGNWSYFLIFLPHIVVVETYAVAVTSYNYQ